MTDRRYYRRKRPLFTSQSPQSVQKPKMKWVVLPVLWAALKRTCTALGAMVLMSAVFSFWVVANLVPQGGAAGPALPEEMVLYINFDGGLDEIPPEAAFPDPFAVGAPTVRELVEAIDAAAKDKRVQGMLARMESGSFSTAHVQELRAAIKAFREAGKFAYIYSPSYGEAGGGLGRYYLASAFEEIWMQPLGVVSVGGISAEIPYFKDTLDKIGVGTNFYQRKEYKTAYESISHSEITPANKEMLNALIGDIRHEITADVAKDLGTSTERFEKLVDKGLFTAREAEEEGLIHYADYADELVEIIKELVTGDPEADDSLFVDIGHYAQVMNVNGREGLLAQTMHSDNPKVALIYAVGAIMPDKSGSGVAAAEEIAPALLDAADDDSISAVVLRIDSPGGSPTASESILRAVERVKEKGKPVIVSMGPTAASGGYWIAASADRIFVLPTTITGSIGVLGGKFYMRDLWEKLGVNWETIKWGENAGMWSINTPFSETESERMNAMLDQIYDAFLDRVAKGRKMKKEDVDKIAKGRVWSGRAAIKIGLADEVGGLTDALDYAANMAGFQSRASVTVEVLPRPKTTVEQIIELLNQGGVFAGGAEWQKTTAEILTPLAQQARIMRNPEDYMVYQPLAVE
ncbi:MAG TPA: signal peptide peptidase SppA [Rhodospirillaceae bacterium]|nr:signal peptide peptidase SppA [Rhodospirillaceae bacterium]